MNFRETILYEQPVAEYVRVCLRLEHLLNKVQNCLSYETEWHRRIAVETLLEILEMSERTDLKSLLSKEIYRFHAYFGRLTHIEAVDQNTLKIVLNELQNTIDFLNLVGQRLSQDLRNHDFLNTIRLYRSNPGGPAHFDVPVYHYWLNQPPAIQLRDLKVWLQELEPLEKIVRLLLKLLRSNEKTTMNTAHNGYFQLLLDPKNPCQLIRVKIPSELQIYPEISVGRHRLGIRFLIPNMAEKSMQTADEVTFQLSCCIV